MARVHVVALPYSLLTINYEWCAHSAKIWRFIHMLHMAGHEAIVYGPDIRSDYVNKYASEYVPIVFESDRVEWFGAPEWDNTQVFDRWDSNDSVWQTSNKRAAAEIEQRWRPGDIVGIIAGTCQQQIPDELQHLRPIAIEWGIGYKGVAPTTHKVFESYAWMHYIAGIHQKDDINYYDTVIPICFDRDDFTFSSKPGDYLLYLGRPIPRKGLLIVADIAKRSGIPVKIAGHPGHDIPYTEYVGMVTGEAKRELLAGARALIAPTTYLEPFGAVVVEAMLSGTPAITTDWGAFTETVSNGVSGYRCRVLAEFLQAVEKSADLNRTAVRKYALERYSTDVGALQYDWYLRKVSKLNGDGWYDTSLGDF